MSWEYSDLSHTAKKHGDPEKYIELIRMHERQQTAKIMNRKWLRNSLPILLLMTPFAVKGLRDFVKQRRKKVTDEEAKQAEENLVQYIRESDDKENPYL